MRAQGVVKGVVNRLAGKLMGQERSDREAGADDQGIGKGRDVLSTMMRARKDGEDAGLTDQQILDNVSV